MALLLPVLLWLLFIETRAACRRKILMSLLWGILMIVACGVSIMKAEKLGFGNTNSYNRFYNGIGWSLQAVSTWPTHYFFGRQWYFDAHLRELQAESEGLEPFPGKSLMGTAFFPTGATLGSRAWSPSGTDADRAMFTAIIQKGSASDFFGAFLTNPHIIAPYLYNIYMVELSSDYRLSYIAVYSWNIWLKPLVLVIKFISSQIGELFVAQLVIALLISKYRMPVVLYFIVAAPLFVVAGDGYFEFERHMAPYIMLTPAILSLAARHRIKSPGCSTRTDPPLATVSKV